jgi:hypothetical protein
MWICFNDGFVSAVEDTEDNTGLMVRARRKEHLEAVFPDRVSDIYSVLKSDYAFRIRVSKKDFADIVTNRIMTNLDYPNFKNSVDDSALHDFYSRVWWAGLDLQR